MKLFFDARYIETGFHNGISRYSAELGGALARLQEITFIICDEKQRDLLPQGASCIMLHKPTSIKEPFTSLLLNKYQPDVVFSPMQTMGTFGRKFKLILTLHDMIYYRHRTPPKNMAAPIRAGWWLFHSSYVPQRLTLNQADVVVTVSQTSKQDIVAAMLTKRPVIVIPNAPQQLTALLDDKQPQHEANKNLIYMGSFMPYKNVETLIAGLKYMPDKTLHLLSRITPKRRDEYARLIPPGCKVVFHNGVSDKQYADLLADDAVMVSGSLDEGYGLPLAEALAMGIPAVVSDLKIFKEVAGEGALYFEPEDPQDFALKVQELDDIKRRQVLINAGLEHIQLFSWNASAKILLSTINNLIK